MAQGINGIRLHYLDVRFHFPNRTLTKQSIIALIQNEGSELNHINYIFCSDAYLLKLNQVHLAHDTLTDIITFPYHQKGQPILSDIYISTERVQENAAIFKATFTTELLRVMFHGALHLCGYGDKSKKEKETMRQKEDFYLQRIYNRST